MESPAADSVNHSYGLYLIVFVKNMTIDIIDQVFPKLLERNIEYRNATIQLRPLKVLKILAVSNSL